MNITQYFMGNSYPGRIIAAGLNHKGQLVSAYAIMGRSTNSRNRVFELTNGELKTKAYDEALVKDPSLIIYPAILKTSDKIIVANGDQSLNIKKALETGLSIKEGIEERTFEPDEPNFTPRISLVIRNEWDCASGCTKVLDFAINRRNEDGSCERKVWTYNAEPGKLYIIHTYEKDGNPLPSFVGKPRVLELDNEDFAPIMWNSLDKDNRISLYVKEGEKETLFNAREGE